MEPKNIEPERNMFMERVREMLSPQDTFYERLSKQGITLRCGYENDIIECKTLNFDVFHCHSSIPFDEAKMNLDEFTTNTAKNIGTLHFVMYEAVCRYADEKRLKDLVFCFKTDRVRYEKGWITFDVHYIIDDGRDYEARRFAAHQHKRAKNSIITSALKMSDKDLLDTIQITGLTGAPLYEALKGANEEIDKINSLLQNAEEKK